MALGFNLRQWPQFGHSQAEPCAHDPIEHWAFGISHFAFSANAQCQMLNAQ